MSIDLTDPQALDLVAEWHNVQARTLENERCDETRAESVLSHLANKRSIGMHDAATALARAEAERLRAPKPGRLYWHTDPSYPCPTCGELAAGAARPAEPDEITALRDQLRMADAEVASLDRKLNEAEHDRDVYKERAARSVDWEALRLDLRADFDEMDATWIETLLRRHTGGEPVATDRTEPRP